jgi:hypothetical protein
MALNELAGNPLYDTEDNDDDNDRRLATTSHQPRGRAKQEKESLFAPKKKPTAVNKLTSSGSMKLAGGKLFGKFNMGSMVGEDEMGLGMHRIELSGLVDENGSEFMLDEHVEKKKKEIQWSDAPCIGQKTNHEKKSIEKHEEMLIKQAETKFLNGILNQTILFNQDEDIEIVVTGENKPSTITQSQAFSTLMTQPKQTTSTLFNNSIENTKMIPEGDGRKLMASRPEGGTSLLQQSGISHMSLKRPGEPLIRDRNDLKKILTKSVYDRRKFITEDDMRRVDVETDFTKADEATHNEEGHDGDYTMKLEGKLDIEQMAALEEGNGEGEDDNDESWAAPEEGYDEVKQEIDRIEKMMMSDDEASQPIACTPQRGQENMKKELEDDSSSDSNFLDDEAEDEDEDDEEDESNLEGQDAQSTSNPNAANDQSEAIETAQDEEQTNGEVRVMKRLKKTKEIRESKREEKRRKRRERHAKFLENEKRRKEIVRNGEFYDEEADLGEVIDGKDAGVKNIDVKSL